MAAPSWIWSSKSPKATEKATFRATGFEAKGTLVLRMGVGEFSESLMRTFVHYILM